MNTVGKRNRIYRNFSVFTVCNYFITVNEYPDGIQVQTCCIGLFGVFRNESNKINIVGSYRYTVRKSLCVRGSCECIVYSTENRGFAIGNYGRVVNCNVINIKSYITCIRFMLFVGVFPCSVVYVQLHNIAVQFRIFAVFVYAVRCTAILESQCVPRTVLRQIKVVIIPSIGTESIIIVPVGSIFRITIREKSSHVAVDTLIRRTCRLLSAYRPTNIKPAYINFIRNIYPHTYACRTGNINEIFICPALSNSVLIFREAMRLDGIPVVAHKRICIIFIICQLREVHIICHCIFTAVNHTVCGGNRCNGCFYAGIVSVITGPL